MRDSIWPAILADVAVNIVSGHRLIGNASNWIFERSL